MRVRNPGLLLAAAGLAGCTSIGDLPTERIGSATLTYANGLPAGTAQLLSDGSTVSLAIAVTGMEAGPHGFHLHTTGACRAPDFKSAGGHLNPSGASHGTMSPNGSHLGDLPNLEVGSSGSAGVTVEIDGEYEDVLSAIFDQDGTAIVIHEGPDDYRTDPAGDAGGRIACGVLSRSG